MHAFECVIYALCACALIAGEKWACHPVHLPGPIASLLHSRFRLSGTLPLGRFGTLLPFTCKPDGSSLRLAWVFGVPIHVNKLSPRDPSFDAYVNTIHAQFCASVHDIFNRYKREFGYAADETLTIVDAKARE
eukprot:c5872_g1_i1.p1 GENE.c5872_g1_i1~~c5872_g1_i1.p1  ORF type:complete len:133 (+),score=27.83 c5872_g1_i1:275-673(+)